MVRSSAAVCHVWNACAVVAEMVQVAASHIFDLATSLALAFALNACL